MEGPGGLLDRLTWEQFRAWQEYETLEPFGEERADLRAAIVASVVFNANIVNKRDAATPSKFMARRWFDPTADGDTGKGNGGPPTAEGWQRFKADAQALAEAAEAQTRPRTPRTPQPPRTRKPPTPAPVPSTVPPEA